MTERNGSPTARILQVIGLVATLIAFGRQVWGLIMEIARCVKASRRRHRG